MDSQEELLHYAIFLGFKRMSAAASCGEDPRQALEAYLHKNPCALEIGEPLQTLCETIRNVDGNPFQSDPNPFPNYPDKRLTEWFALKDSIPIFGETKVTDINEHAKTYHVYYNLYDEYTVLLNGKSHSLMSKKSKEKEGGTRNKRSDAGALRLFKFLLANREITGRVIWIFARTSSRKDANPKEAVRKLTADLVSMLGIEKKSEEKFLKIVSGGVYGIRSMSLISPYAVVCGPDPRFLCLPRLNRPQKEITDTRPTVI